MFNSFQEFLDEAFKDMGNLSPEELKKGQRLDSADNFKEVDARVFYNVISKLKENELAKSPNDRRGLASLSIYTIPEYKDMNCYLGDNNSSGYCLHHDELVSVFSTQGSSGNAIVMSAIKNGAKRLDCFALRGENGIIDGPLFKLYNKHGFKIDTSMNSGKKGEAYSIQNGISSYVDEDEVVHEDDPRVVIFMKL